MKKISSIIIMFGCMLFLSQPMNAQENNATTGSLNGHEWVDLGLPSGTKWATCNVGANAPEQYGNHYAWGETKPKDEYSQSNSVTYQQNISDFSGDPQYDAATANWGEGWKMPTKTQMEELNSKCTWEWIKQNSVWGYKVTGPNGNSIFLPASGYWSSNTFYDATCDYTYFWSSTSESSSTYGAYDLRFDSGYHDVNYLSRDYGCSVRAVAE